MQDTQVATRSFRLACARLWLVAGLAHLFLLAVVVLAVNLTGLLVEPIWLIVMCIIPFGYWVVYGLMYRLTVSASGLGWINSAGVNCSLSWSEIERAERIKLLGFEMLKVWSRTQGGPWDMPLFLIDRDILCEAVQESAGETHPVRIAVAD